VAVAAIVRTGLSGDLAYVSSAAVDQQAIERVDIQILPGTSGATAFAALRTALAGQQATLVTTAQAAAALTGSVDDSSSTTTLSWWGGAALGAGRGGQHHGDGNSGPAPGAGGAEPVP
jgi:hypothetical protein